MIRVLLVALALFQTAGALAQERHVCRSGNIVRVISVEYEFKGWDVPCKVKYDKQSEGLVSYPWHAETSPGYCEDRAAFLAGKLSNWGWVCSTEEVNDRETND